MVNGRASFTGESVNWREAAAELSLEIPDPPSEPKREDYSSVDAFRQAEVAFWTSEKGHEIDRARRSYAVYCTEDGSFSIPDVPPGKYDLKIDLSQGLSAASVGGRDAGVLEKEITVPESAEDHEVLDLGTLEVPAAKVNQRGSVQFKYAR